MPASTPLLLHKCTDFEVTGTGENTAWNKAEWNALTQLDLKVQGYDSRFKILYSAKGIYVLFDGKGYKYQKSEVEYNKLEETYTLPIVKNPGR